LLVMYCLAVSRGTSIIGQRSGPVAEEHAPSNPHKKRLIFFIAYLTKFVTLHKYNSVIGFCKVEVFPAVIISNIKKNCFDLSSF